MTLLDKECPFVSWLKQIQWQSLLKMAERAFMAVGLSSLLTIVEGRAEVVVTTNGFVSVGMRGL